MAAHVSAIARMDSAQMFAQRGQEPLVRHAAISARVPNTTTAPQSRAGGQTGFQVSFSNLVSMTDWHCLHLVTGIPGWGQAS